MTNKLILTAIILSFAQAIFGQTQKSLSEQLWDRIESCYSMFEEWVEEDGKMDYDELIDDSKNGYLSVSGSFPTCGCYCSSTVGAYKGSDGNYTFLEKETWSCSWVHRISSNKELESVFPENFVDVFIPKGNNNAVKNAMFYLDVEIPRIGTDTKLTIKTIPMGIYIESNSILSYEYAEDLSKNYTSFYYIWYMANKIKNTETVDLILNGQFEEIPQSDTDVVNDAIGDGEVQYKSRNELSKYLNQLKQTYDIYCSIEHGTVILGWDREKARFFVKEKGDRPKFMTFREFLTENMYLGPAC